MGKQQSKGFTLIELMIVITIIAVLLSLALPAYQDYTIRAKVTEGLSISAGVKAGVAETCQTDPLASWSSIAELGYSEIVSSEYVEWVDSTSSLFAGLGFGLPSCLVPVIGFRSINTGADVEPAIFLVGVLGQGRMQWLCFQAAGESKHVPASCRNPIPLIPGLPSGGA